MSDLLMRGRSLRIVAVGLQPQLQPLAVADSLAARIAAPTTRAAQTRPQRRRHALGPDEQWQPSHESGPASIQAGRSPPWRSVPTSSRTVHSNHRLTIES